MTDQIPTPTTMMVRQTFALYQTNTDDDIGSLTVDQARERMGRYLEAFDRWADQYGVPVSDLAVEPEPAEVRSSE